MGKELMKVSIIDPVGGHGGMDYYDYGLAYGLGANDIEVTYYTCNKTKHRSFANVYTENIFGTVWDKKGVYKLLTFLGGYFRAFKKAKEKKSSVFHLQFFSLDILNLVVLFLASIFKQKKIVTLHDVESFHGNSSKFIAKCCLKFVDAIIVHNKFSKSEFEKTFNFKRELFLIPHGNYLPFVEPLSMPVIEEQINILFFGQIKEVKGVDVLLEAMAKVVVKNNNYHLTIAGRPWKTDANTYQTQIEELGLKEYVTTRLEYIADEEVKQLYRDASIVVMPYKKIYQSGVLLLSLSYGRAVIVSDLKPFTEVISHNENGYVFQSENADSLANCILNIYSDNLIKVTENAKKVICTKYDWKSIGSSTLSCYSKIKN